MRASSGPADPRRAGASGRTPRRPLISPAAGLRWRNAGPTRATWRGGAGAPGRRRGHPGPRRRTVRTRPRAGAVRLRRPPLVRSRPADLAGPRRRLHLRRRAASPAPPEPAPAGHGRRGRPLRLPRRPVGAAAADRPLPRRHDLRHRGPGRPGLRDRAPRAPAGPRHRPGRPPLRRQRSPPADLGPHRRGRQLPGRLPALRRATHGPRPSRTPTSATWPASPSRSAYPTRPARWPGSGTAWTPTDRS